MEEHKLDADIRKKTNKGQLKQLRREGFIPAIVYGNKQTPIIISINARAFRHAFSHISESTLIALHINGETKTVLIKDYEEDLIRNTVVHIDFFEVSQNKALSTHVSVILEGAAEGVRTGGVLEHFLHEVEVECLPKDLPETIPLSIEALDVGDSLHVSDLPSLSGVTYKNAESQVIVHIATPKKVSLEPELEEVEEEEELEQEEETN